VQSLPIDSLLPEVVAALRANPSLVLEAPPGAGKTTRVPPALLEAGLAGTGEILVLQPRRLAARLAAARVSEERGERLGETIGYQIRFDDVSGPKTRVKFLTEGLLTRRLVSEPALPGVGAVLLDEFHERHLAGDLALALLRRLQGTRKDLKLVVMSATLDAGPIAQWLGCPSLRSEGRRFEVEISHAERADERHLEQQVAGAVKRLLADGLDGDVLVFLPGAAEIRRAREALEEVTGRHGIELHALHGDLSAQEQDRAVKPGRARKIILSTNVAETSVTIEGVSAVVDSGLARVAAHSPWSGMPTLKLANVSRASAIQRAGRAGRTRAGKCVRLYTKGDFDGRPAHDAPEISRLDLAEALLALRGSGVRDVKGFGFFESPPAAALSAAEDLLARLGAVSSSGELTEIGKRLLEFPLHPRLARIVVEAERRGVAGEGATIAALLGERDIRLETRARVGSGPGGSDRGVSGPSDILELVERFEGAVRGGARSHGVDAGAVQSVDRVRKQLERRIDKRAATRPATTAAVEEAQLHAVLAGYPDRVARRRRPRAPEVVLAGGGSATLDATSVVHDAELMVAVDAEERKGGVVVRIASKVEPEWLLELGGDRIGDFEGFEWNGELQRVEKVTRLTYDGLALEETRQPAQPSEGAAKVLAEAALKAGIERFCDKEALASLRSRIEALRGAFPEVSFPALDDAFVRQVLLELCQSVKSFKELENAGLLDALMAHFTPEQTRLLIKEAPERFTLAGGRTAKVNWEPSKPPWLESRLQDFFGSLKGPSILGGRVPLVLHLLAPNMRAVQVTTDLAGFWERHYPAIRKELMRKYPRHSWPEDPKTAVPISGPIRRKS
jgi:ATP-dependent helicase HrpB